MRPTMNSPGLVGDETSILKHRRRSSHVTLSNHQHGAFVEGLYRTNTTLKDAAEPLTTPTKKEEQDQNYDSTGQHTSCKGSQDGIDDMRPMSLIDS